MTTNRSSLSQGRLIQLKPVLTRFSAEVDDHLDGLVLHRRRPRVQEGLVLLRVAAQVRLVRLVAVDLGVEQQDTAGALKKRANKWLIS